MGTGLTAKRSQEILTDVHDVADHSIRTTLTNAEVNLNVSAFTDSIKIGDGSGDTATITTIGPKKSLDVVVNDITIDHVDDSIKLGDGVKLVSVSSVAAKNGLDVNVINSSTTTTTIIPSGETGIYYGSITNLAINATQIGVQYIVPSGNSKYMQRIYVSGTQVGTFLVKLNAGVLFKIRLSPAVFTSVLELATGSAFGTEIITGDTVTIEAENNGTNIADFDITLQLMEP